MSSGQREFRLTGTYRDRPGQKTPLDGKHALLRFFPENPNGSHLWVLAQFDDLALRSSRGWAAFRASQFDIDIPSA